MGVLVNPDRHKGRRRLTVNLWVEDISHLRDHTICMGKVCIGTKPIDCCKFREIHLGRCLESQVLEPVVPALEIGLSFKPKRIKAGKVLLPVLVALRPREVAYCMGFPVSNRHIAIPTLLNVPYNFFHHHQVAQVWVTGWHEPGQDMELLTVMDRIGDHLVIAVPEDDTPAEEIGDFGQVTNRIPDG